MEHRNLQASVDALVAIKAIVGDTLIAAYPRPIVPRVGKLTRNDLAYELKPLQHASLLFYLRSEATKEALLLIREAVEDALNLLDAGDEEICRELSVVEPFRHHLYVRALVTALRVVERDEIREELEFWRRRNAMRVVSATVDV